MSTKLPPSNRGRPHLNDTQRCVDIRGQQRYDDNQVVVRARFQGVN